MVKFNQTNLFKLLQVRDNDGKIEHKEETEKINHIKIPTQMPIRLQNISNIWRACYKKKALLRKIT